jgi:hypothetical protein
MPLSRFAGRDLAFKEFYRFLPVRETDEDVLCQRLNDLLSHPMPHASFPDLADPKDGRRSWRPVARTPSPPVIVTKPSAAASSLTTWL